MIVYGLDPGASDPEGDAQRDAYSRLHSMSYAEIIALAEEALDEEDRALAVMEEYEAKLLKHLAAKILESA